MTAYTPHFQVDVLENDASEVLSLIRSIKNSFASINRIPPEVLSLVPGCYVKDRAGQDLIKLTHVCSGWRNTFISCPPLWTQLDFKNVDKTRTYIQERVKQMHASALSVFGLIGIGVWAAAPPDIPSVTRSWSFPQWRSPQDL